jgi:hypothetical protein
MPEGHRRATTTPTTMNTMSKTLSTAAIALAIALTLSMGSHGQTPKPDADAGGPRRWQHLAMEVDAKKPLNDQGVSEQVNKLGTDGWELVAVDSVLEGGATTRRIMFFKRPL